MDYSLLICVSDKRWTAIDVNADGDCDRVSFDGNEDMEVDSVETVTDFCAQILNYYNINAFNDIILNVKIVVISEYSKLITDLFMQMKDAKSINVIDLKSIIPIYVLKKCIVKPGSMIDVRCMKEKFTLHVDDALVVSYVSEEADEEIVIAPESFSILFRFDCRNLISYEAELKALEEKCVIESEKKQKKIDKHKKLYSELKKKYVELEKNYVKLQDEVEKSKTQLDDKCMILRFTSDELEESSSLFLFRPLWRYMDSLTEILATTTGYGERKKYVCRLLKSDGDIVKKGDQLIEIIEIYSSIKGDEPRDTGRKSVIKANEDGRIFYLVKNNDSVEDNEAVVLVYRSDR